MYALALLHRRSLRPPVAPEAHPSGSLLSPSADKEPLTSSSPLSTEEGELSHRIAQVEARLTTICEQLTQVALLLVEEREQRDVQRITTLESRLPTSFSEQKISHEAKTGPTPEVRRGQKRHLHPADQQARFRSPALVQYVRTEERYLIFSRA